MPAASLNYYDILEVKRGATPAGIKQAFRKLALKWHPERAADKIQAEKMFPLVCEAYDVLVHPARREIFDQYGEAGLKNGIPDGAGGVTGGRYTFARKPEDVYTQFFGTSSPFTDLLGPMNGASPELYGELTGMTMIKQPIKPEPLVIEMPVTLRDIYNGTSKKLTYVRRTLQPDKTTVEKLEAINLLVAPGWEDGTVATYPVAGDEGVDNETADVQVRMVTEPEQPWGRQGSTLYYTATITLLEALCGKVLSIPTFDGRELSVPVTQIVAPGVTKVVKGEGMPDVETGEKGDLVIQFATVFPETLTPAQKASIKQTLAR